VVVEITCEGEVFTLVAADGRVHLEPGPAASADVALAGPTDATVGLLLGRITASAAAARGVTVRGATRRLRGLRPRGERAAPHPR
jgi:hypothetical protein